jgi:hypothetical protein
MALHLRSILRAKYSFMTRRLSRRLHVIESSRATSFAVIIPWWCGQRGSLKSWTPLLRIDAAGHQRTFYHNRPFAPSWTVPPLMTVIWHTTWPVVGRNVQVGTSRTGWCDVVHPPLQDILRTKSRSPRPRCEPQNNPVLCPWPIPLLKSP